ncbi:hypothetical protein [Pseudomonas sp. UBA4194]|uniref:hypothetical protein n=1 Tax=Pseudomonas sp. UBA4194 TaxID=1947317 RepID=UPI0025E5A567|nr:hypothetical protein [Pseudomonas sp. UBA4194]
MGKDMDPFRAKHSELNQKHLDALTDEGMVILKVHLVIEELLRDFCGAVVPNPKHLREARLTFKQTMLLARSLTDHDIDWIWAVLRNLNRMRNLMAHAVEPSEEEYSRCRNTIIQLVSEARPGGRPDSLKGALQYAYGWLGGMLSNLVTTKHLRPQVKS